MKNAFSLILSILLCQLAGLIGSVFTTSAIPNWYATLQKPSFNPPSWIFGPVWITLYLLMGISLYLVWLKRGSNSLTQTAIILFVVHLILNALWSIIFFGLKNPMIAFFEIIVLWIMIVVLIYIFFKIDKRSAYLLLPYFLWVSFASILNFSIWQLNK
jgi:translocator protein